MARAHMKYVVSAGQGGGVVVGARVTPFLHGTTTPVSDMYDAESGGNLITYVLTNTQGEAEAWFSTAKTIDVQVSDNTDTAYISGASGELKSWETFTETLEVQPAPEDIPTSTVLTTVQTDILTKIGYDPMNYGATGNGSANDSTALTDAIAACHSAGGGIVVIRKPHNIDADVTVNSGVWLSFAPQGYLIMAAGRTLTYNEGDFLAAPSQKIFDCSASGASVVAAKVGTFYYEWFGAKGDGTGDDGPSINKTTAVAIAGGKNASTQSGGGRVYRHTTKISFGGANTGIGFHGRPGMAFQQGSHAALCTLRWAGTSDYQVEAGGDVFMDGWAFQNYGTARSVIRGTSTSERCRLRNICTIVADGTGSPDRPWSEAAINVWDFNYSEISEWEGNSAPSLKYGRYGTITVLDNAVLDPQVVTDRLAWQAVSVDATGGTFTLTYSGQTTAALAYNAPAAVVQDALESLSNLCRGAVNVVGGPTPAGSLYPYYLTFGARVDASCGVTSSSATVTDTSITADDNGLIVYGAGIPPNTYVGTVTAGTSFLLSSSRTSQVNINATATGTVNIAIRGAGLGAAAVSAVTANSASLTGGTHTATVRNAIPCIVPQGTADGITIGPRFTFNAEAASHTLFDNSHLGEYWQALSTNATGGTFTVTYKGQTTGAIAYNASAATVSTALNALSTVTADGGVMVRGGALPVHVYVTFKNIGKYTAFTVDSSSLTGATHTATVTQPIQARISNLNLDEVEIDCNSSSTAVLSPIRATNIDMVSLSRGNASNFSQGTDGICLLTESTGVAEGVTGASIPVLFRTASRNALADRGLNSLNPANTLGVLDPTGQVGSSVSYMRADPNRDLAGYIRLHFERARSGSVFFAEVTDNSNYTVQPALHGDSVDPGNIPLGLIFGVQIYNNSGGSLGTITFNTTYFTLASTFIAPGNGTRVTIYFSHDGTKAREMFRTYLASPSAITQTYSTVTRTHAALTSATLTDNSAGTADSTVAAMPDPADSPATADALRDDIVANLLPALRNNIADLTAQVNALRVDLVNVKGVLNGAIDDLQSEGWLA